MTQFIVFSGPEPDLAEHIGLHSVPLKDDVVSEYTGQAIPKDLIKESWVLRGRGGEPGHDLCNDAMLPAQEFGSIEESELGKLLKNYLSTAKAITFFYATDSDNLIEFHNKNDFLDHLSECLSGKSITPWEIYAVFKAVR